MNAKQHSSAPGVLLDESPRAGGAAHFDTGHLSGDTLGRRTVESGAAALGAQGLRLSLQLGGTIVLARLLAPEEYGLFAVVFAVVTFFSVFRETGLAAATVQSAEVSHAQVSGLFWIGLALCLLLTVGAALAAPAVGWFYGEPRLVPAIAALACGLALAGLGAQHRALLRRQMRFAALSIIDVASAALGLAAGLVCAFAGARLWSLVVMHLTTHAAATLGLWLVCDWRPGAPTRGAGLRPLLAFGGDLTGFELASYFARNADFLLVGWFFGARQLGFYDKAFQLLLVPVMNVALPLGGVAFTALSRLRDDATRFRDYYERCLLLTAAAGMPFVAFLFVTAERIVPFALGPQWAGAAPIFRALAPAAFVAPLYAGALWVTSARGRTRQQLAWGAASSAVTVAGFLCGLRWGAVGVAVSFSVTRVLMLAPTLRYCYKDSPLRWRATLSNVKGPALASVLAALPVMLVETSLAENFAPARALALAAWLYFIVYVSAWLATQGGRDVLRELLALAATYFGTRATGKA